MWPARPPRSGAPGRSPRPGSRPRFPWSPRRACAKAIRLLPRPPPRRPPSRRPRPATQPRRPRQAPSRPGARTAKRRAAGDPQSRPGTRSCSAVPASETYGELSRDRPRSPGDLGTSRLASRFSPAPLGLPSRTLPRTEQAARRLPRRPEGPAGGRWRESHGCLGSIHELGDVAADGGAGRCRLAAALLVAIGGRLAVRALIPTAERDGAYAVTAPLMPALGAVFALLMALTLASEAGLLASAQGIVSNEAADASRLAWAATSPGVNSAPIQSALLTYLQA